MRWICRRLPPATEEDHEYEERVEKVTDLTVRLRTQRKRNGFGKLFDDALHAPRRERNTG